MSNYSNLGTLGWTASSRLAERAGELRSETLHFDGIPEKTIQSQGNMQPVTQLSSARNGQGDYVFGTNGLVICAGSS